MSPTAVVIRADHATFDWSGGQGIDVAEVRVNLSDLAAHFFAPILQDGNSVAFVLAVPGVGPMTVAGESMDAEGRPQRELTPEEVQQMAFSYRQSLLWIGKDASVEAAKAFVRARFPAWAQVYFYDEHPLGRPAETAYEGPSKLD